MRRVGLVLAGLGTCLIVFAVLMPTWVSSRVLKFPLNEYASVTLAASNASYFSPTKLTAMTGVNMEATYTIKGNAAAGSSSTAVWNQFVYVYDQTNKLPFQTMTRTFAFNRRTAQLVNCCGANVNGDSSVQQTGYVGYVLPIGTQQKTYNVFDTNLKKPVPFTFAGTAIVNGILAYRFTGNVSPTQNGSQTLPGSLVGQSAASVTLPQFYENHVTYWIDPDTGALLNVTQNERLTLKDSTGAQALVLFDAYLAATPASVNGLVALDNSQRSKKSTVTTVLPLVTGILGVILLIVGIVLARRPREDVEAGPSAGSPELAVAESEEADHSATQATQATQASLVPGLEDEPREATVESPVVKKEAAQPEAAQPKAAQPKAAQPKAAKLRAAKAPPKVKPAEPEGAAAGTATGAAAADAEAKAADPGAEGPEAEAPAAEGAAEAKAEAAESQEPPAESQAAAESQPAAESPKAEDAPAEAPTAEMPAAASGESPEAAADAPDEAPTSAPRRGRRGAHRR
jgi:hypothetical protein